MIQLLSKVDIIDNTGGKLATCIKILNPKGRKIAKIGDIILVSINKTIANSKVNRGGVYKAIVVRTKIPIKNPSQKLSFTTNSVVLIKQALSKKKYDFTPIGTRIAGPISSILKLRTGCTRVHFLAKSIL
jgi:large subunit ribosomal protein L14